MLRKLESMGFKFNLVLADSLYGESGTNFISVLDELNLNYSGDSLKSFRRATSKKRIQYLKWHRFKKSFPISLEYRFIREISWQAWKKVLADYYRYCCITWSPTCMLWVISRHYLKRSWQLLRFKTWVEYGLKQSKNELGWADYRLTHPDIERWWRLFVGTYLMVSLTFRPNVFFSTTIKIHLNLLHTLGWWKRLEEHS